MIDFKYIFINLFIKIKEEVIVGPVEMWITLLFD